ncbi:MAG: hypothetical protein AB7U29_17900 [Desulfobulbus sp.]
MNINSVNGSGYTNPMFQTPPQTSGGQSIQQTQKVQQGPTEENQEGMASQKMENATNAEAKEGGGFSVYA